MTKEITLGLGDPPIPIYLFVGNGLEEGKLYSWYKCDSSNGNKTIPVYQRALTGYIKELQVKTKEYKGKENAKLDILVSADENYVIRTGLETTFAKSLLLGLLEVDDLTKPLIIVVTPGEETVVFCALYDAETKSRIKITWQHDLHWLDIVQEINEALC
jgi:hypothetical protein